MHKQAQIADWNEVGRYGAAGVAGGITLTALYKLMHEIQSTRQMKALSESPTETDENTIVLKVPQKVAEIVGITAVPAKTGPKASLTKQTRKGVAMGGHYRGATGMKVAVEIVKGAGVDPTTWAMRLISLAGGGALGYSLADKTYRMYADRQLKSQEEQAKQEMLDAMQSKRAFLHPDFSKAEPNDQQGGMATAFGPLVLAGILSTSGAAYLTKRILDAKTKETQNAGYEPPKVRRIIFQSVPVRATSELPEGDKQASEEDARYIRTSIACYQDLLGGESRLLKDAALRDTLKAAGCDLSDVPVEAGHDEFLQKVAHPVVERIQQAIDKDPAIMDKLAQVAAPNNRQLLLDQVPAAREFLSTHPNATEALWQNYKGMAPALVRTMGESAGQEARQKFVSSMPDSWATGLVNKLLPGQASMGAPAAVTGAATPGAAAPGAAAQTGGGFMGMLGGLGAGVGGFVSKNLPTIAGAALPFLAAGAFGMFHRSKPKPRKTYEEQLQASTGLKSAIDLDLVQQGLNAESDDLEAPLLTHAHPASEADVRERMKHVEIGASDPNAARYAVQVSPRLKRVLHELAEEGKI